MKTSVNLSILGFGLTAMAVLFAGCQKKNETKAEDSEQTGFWAAFKGEHEYGPNYYELQKLNDQVERDQAAMKATGKVPLTEYQCNIIVPPNQVTYTGYSTINFKESIKMAANNCEALISRQNNLTVKACQTNKMQCRGIVNSAREVTIDRDMQPWERQARFSNEQQELDRRSRNNAIAQQAPYTEQQLREAEAAERKRSMNNSMNPGNK